MSFYLKVKIPINWLHHLCGQYPQNADERLSLGAGLAYFVVGYPL
jgi:hypothetical protein